ncbi:MAG: hypothetical protein HXX20_16650 [Chloroflexi bacterium]|nr:hypothetical protein [Chloroflexota bacterium]
MAYKQDGQDSDIFVQSCIITNNFPETLEEMLSVVEKHGEDGHGKWMSDMDLVMEYAKCDPDDYWCEWTVPKWLTIGDKVFFYHALGAKQRVPKLLRQARREYAPESDLAKLLEQAWNAVNPTDRTYEPQNDLVKLLEHCYELMEKYSGKIYGCAELIDKPKSLPEDEEGYIYISKIHIFENPIDRTDFREFIKISPGATITPLSGGSATQLKQRLGDHNQLPEYLQIANFEDKGFHNVNRDTWISISCAPHTRFRLEYQIRAYFIDFLLDELKDERSPLLEECECFKKDNSSKGIVDYFVRIEKTWLPVEAKLNILAERHLFLQTAKYLDLEKFVPKKGSNIGKPYEENISSYCLVIDLLGLYIVNKDGFVNCDYNNPVWRRVDIGRELIADIRSTLGKLISG